MDEFRIVGVEFDEREWALLLTLADGTTDRIKMINWQGFFTEAENLRRVQVCECGHGVMFLDYGAFYHRELGLADDDAVAD
jgi:hypothetical protein